MKKFNAAVTVLLWAMASVIPHGACAQSFPTQPVKIVVPFPPGGSTDVVARLLATELARKWNQPVIVENRAGAGGTIFSEQFARAPADGNTLMLTATHHVINPRLYKALKYDTRTAFTPIAQVAAVPNVLVANPSFTPRSVKELILLAKANPGKLNFGSSGSGGSNHLSGELFKAMAGVDMTHVPYKGAAPALNDVLGGQIPMTFDSVPGVVQHIKAGKLSALAVTSLKRSQVLPDVPTMDEAGVKGFEATAWFGLYAPGHLAHELSQKLSHDVLQALQSPLLRAQLLDLGAEPGTMSQVEFAAFVHTELDKWARVIADAKVKLE